MHSLSKVVLFSLISCATLALAISAPEHRSSNTKALLAGANIQLATTMCPVAYATPSNNTVANIGPILAEVTSILNELLNAFKGTNHDCTMKEVVQLVADLLKTILDPLSTACGSNSDLLSLVGGLVAAIVELIETLVGPSVANLLALLIKNGVARIIVNLGLVHLTICLGIGQTVVFLLNGLSSIL